MLLVGGVLTQAVSAARGTTKSTNLYFGEVSLEQDSRPLRDSGEKPNDDRQRHLNTLIVLSERFREWLSN